MSETKWTPGPWVWRSISMNDGNYGVSAVSVPIVIASVHNAASFGDMIAGALKRGGGELRQDDNATQRANARLIAAAPELYEALDQILDDMGNDGLSCCQAAKDQARAALAKARGETP